MELKQHIESLFQYLSSYEKDYGSFETEAFIQTYNGIRAVFKPLQTQRTQAVEVDYIFLDFVQASPITSSDLRKLTIQTLISYFEAEADVDGRSNQAYSYVRNLRSDKQDVLFFVNGLAPLLFREGALNNNFALNSFFLREISKFLNSYGPALNNDITPENFDSMDDSTKFLTLSRRREKLGDDLISDRSTIEFRLQQVGTIQNLSSKSNTMNSYLSDWQYLKEQSNFWQRVGKWFLELGDKGMGLFTSFGYTRLVFRQRRPAVFLNALMIVVWVSLTILTTQFWLGYSSDKLRDLMDR